MHHAAERAAVLRFLQRAARHLGDSGSDGVVRAAVDSFLPGGWGDCARYGRRNGSHRALGVSATSCHWFRLDRPVLGTQMQEEANYQISLASLQDHLFPGRVSSRLSGPRVLRLFANAQELLSCS